ncbi:hypothetical protein Poli38472_014724 [Pythium oligandrum]|uniref:Microsomal glutathione S-transferase 1 n=1 Tax=Pythium oligandrum TaxID=41045 RepID=A0A8K1C236_PYTOL|nr:hypothetical protein Poli38472_014724 [Pythium oligandrum]|eukprot:TMW54953.1 hypothetical protein Poli38472_014724 [Pythium oligandrum]
MDANRSEFRVLVGCVAVLYIKFLVTCMIQGRKGFIAGGHVEVKSPRHSVARLELEVEPAAGALEAEARWKRIIQNDLESIPFALVVFLVAVSANGPMTTVNTVLMLTYTITRIAHTISYATKHAMARMLTWMTGVFCIMGGIGSAIRSSL